MGEKATGSSDLRKRLGQLFYLENLAKVCHIFVIVGVW